jgi:hypothetical protein
MTKPDTTDRFTGPYVDLWRMLFKYAGVWRGAVKPAWYVSFPEDVAVLKTLLRKHRSVTMNRGLDRHYRVMRLAVLMCSDERCRCGHEAMEIVGETMATVKPVCATCYMKEKR